VIDDRLQTTVDGIFAAGNVLHVHDIVDWVSKEAIQAGEYAAKYIRELKKRDKGKKNKSITVKPGAGIRYVLPHRIQPKYDVTLYFRVIEPMSNIYIELLRDGEYIKRVKHRKVHPGMMLRLKLDKKELLHSKELLVEIQEK